MKSSIFNLKYLLAALFLCAFALNARAQSGPPYYVDLASLSTNIVDNYHWATVSNTSYGFTNAPMHIHDTNIATGEFVLNAFNKVNSNMVWEVAQNATNYNLWLTLNTFVFDYAVTNGGSGYLFAGDTLSNSLYMNGTLTNCTYAGDGTYLSNLNGANIIPDSQINDVTLTNSAFAGNGFYITNISSNSFDANTLEWLQSCDVAGVLTDSSSSTGTAGYYPVANGSGGWAWTPPLVQPGTSGSELELVLRSPNGTAIYVHVADPVAGVSTLSATTSP